MSGTALGIFFLKIQIMENKWHIHILYEGYKAIIKFKGLKVINCIETWTYLSDLFRFQKLNLQNAIYTWKNAELDFYVEQLYHTIKCLLGYTTVIIKWWSAKQPL